MRLASLLALAVAQSGTLASVEAQAPRFDVVIRHGTVIDGTGSPGYAADVGVAGGRIAAIARGGLPARSGRVELDARGLVVSPGFIDHHAHISTNIHERPLAENFLYQGITTIVASLHSGDVPWPLAAYMDSLRTAPNIAFFCGHSWIRREVLGLASRAPTPSELARMRDLTDQCMRDGALGLSTGLLYVPANYATTEEVIELARVAARHGGLYVTHMRDEARGLIASVREAIRIGEEAGLPVQINHHKAAGAGQFGWSDTTLALIDAARARGVDVTHDLYPYAAGSTGSGVLFPQWALAGGPDSLRARVDNPAVRRRLETEMVERMRADWAGEDLGRIQFRELPSDRRYDGRTMADMARDRGRPVSAVTGVELAIELQLKGGFTAIYHMMDERDVIAIMKHPLAMFETDGDPIGYGRGFPHPRSYGAFPRVLARYVREQQVLTLEDAIRRMTSLSAAQIGQGDLGLIQEGRRADIVVFDAERIADLATYQDPHRFSVGMVHILVNGQVVLRDGSLTGARPGRVLKGPARATGDAGSRGPGFAGVSTPGSPRPASCRVLETPRRLPSVAAVLDSFALTGAIAATPSLGAPDAVLGLAFPERPGPPQAWMIDSALPPDAKARLETLVLATVRRGRTAPGTSLRLRVRTVAPVAMHIERSVLCAPVPLDSTHPAGPTYQVRAGAGGVPAQRWKSVIRQRIGADGVVQEARLRPTSGRLDLDRLALEPVYARRWRPATLDGRPVEVWFEDGRVALVREAK